MNYKNYLKYSKIARKLEKADKVFKNGFVLNVFTEEIVKADIAISDGIIVGIGEYSGKEEIDITGKYVVPGFVDSHLHLESTMVRPIEFLKAAVKAGTTTFIVDPHEVANVSGTDGIDYIIEQTENVPANVFVMIPSCVPAVSFEDNGATLLAETMERYLSNPRVLGLAEVMDTNAVLNGEKNMMEKLEMFKEMNIDGHSPALTDEELAAYALAGIKNDHEACTYEYAKKQIENGLYVLIREGSAARNLEAIVSGIVANKASTERYCFCTDDKHVEEIYREGHICYNIRKAISIGLEPIKAYKMATIQAAQAIRKDREIGAIAPGFKADFVVLKDFEKVEIENVYFEGQDVNEIFKKEIEFPEYPEHLKKTVHVKNFDAKKIEIELEDENAKFPVIEIIEGQIVTKKVCEKIPARENKFVPNQEYNKLVVVERHKNTGKIGVGVLKGFGIKNGAIASTVAHDSHNIVVVGDNDSDIEIAVKELAEKQGGYTIVENGKVVDTLPLVIMGLISDEPSEKVNEKLEKMLEYSKKMGINPNIDPFINLSFLALPVIPEIRVTARGIFDVTLNKFL